MCTVVCQGCSHQQHIACGERNDVTCEKCARLIPVASAPRAPGLLDSTWLSYRHVVLRGLDVPGAEALVAHLRDAFYAGARAGFTVVNGRMNAAPARAFELFHEVERELDEYLRDLVKRALEKRPANETPPSPDDLASIQVHRT